MYRIDRKFDKFHVYNLLWLKKQVNRQKLPTKYLQDVETRNNTKQMEKRINCIISNTEKK
jgi:hypothetical protein